MYLDHYGLTAKPFDKTPNPAFFYRSPIHEEALARLQYGTEERELTLLTGEIGTGKTLLSRALIDLLPDNYHPMLIINPRLSPNQFLKTVAQRLGVESPSYFRADLLNQINQTLYRFYEEDICPVIIIDEAQLIPSKSTFEEIRLLTNFQLDDANLLCLVLIGQPELRKRLKRGTFEAVRQRVGIRYHLGPIGREDTGKYIAHRLETAGGDGELIDEEAVDVIFRYSGGLPRVINNISANALLMGFSKDLSRIGPDVILDVVEDLDLEPV
ncbi:MAG: AAA family ATPase [bacterium]|nr:MAG: AAA family ATPase [bacterium]